MATDAPRNIRNAIKSFIPNWLARTTGFSFIFTVALICDEIVEQLFQGVVAPFPGRGTNTALPLIGRGRGLIRGLLESDAQYAARLQAWLTLWAVAGSPETLVSLIQTFLGDAFVVRLVDKHGNFVTVNANGTTTFLRDAAWDWDSALTYRANWWSEIWLIVYVSDGRWGSYANLSDANWLAAWGTADGFGTGHMVTRDVVDGVYNIVAKFKGAHTWLQSIVWTNAAPTSFLTPGSLGGLPGGAWGNNAHNVSTHQVRARPVVSGGSYVRFWDPIEGG